MLRSLFFRRLFLPYLLLIAVATAAVGIYAALRLRDAYLDGQRQALHQNLLLVQQLVSPDVAAGRYAELNQRIRQLGEQVDCRITVVAADGTVLADNWADPATMVNHLHRPEIAATIAQREAVRARSSATIHQAMLYLAREVDLPDQKHYFLRLAVPLQRLHADLRLFYLAVGGVAILAIFAAGVISYAFARRQAEPILQLTRFADELAHGQLDRHALIEHHDRGELGTLGAALNKLAEAIRTLLTQAIRYDEMRKEFVANVSHELRTPLSVIRGFVETLRDGAINDPVRGPEYLKTVERHTIQLTNLVGDLLELSRLEGQSELPMQGGVDLAAAARKVAELLAPAAQRKSQTLIQDIDPVPPIRGNADYLERAITNLVDNAIKYTPDGGQIRLKVSQDAGRAITIEVSDTGIGIPEQDLPRIFERFYRVDRSRSRDMGGTGLGLSIVKHVAQVHRGTVDVASRPGDGSTFRFRIPL